jgi:hypothetical protein
VKNALGEAFTTALENAQWKLWHGHSQDALTKLAVLRDTIPDEGHRSKLTGLYEYLHRNQAYLINYDARAQAHQTYTSQVAESHIDTLINARHKRTKKCNGPVKGRISGISEGVRSGIRVIGFSLNTEPNTL